MSELIKPSQDTIQEIIDELVSQAIQTLEHRFKPQGETGSGKSKQETEGYKAA